MGYTPQQLVTNFSTHLHGQGTDHNMWLNLGGDFSTGAKGGSCRVAGGAWCGAEADSFRVAGDHHDDWASTADVIEVALAAGRRPWYGPNATTGAGGWMDPDFLFTGGGGCSNHSAPGVRCPGQTDTEYLTEFSLWAVASGQMVFASDPRNMSALQRLAWFNGELIAVFRDAASFGDVAVVRPPVPGAIVWLRPLSSGWVPPPSAARSGGGIGSGSGSPPPAVAAIFNGADAAASVTVAFADVPRRGWGNATKLAVRDMWAHAELGTFTGSYTAANVPAHGTVVVRLTPAAVL